MRLVAAQIDDEQRAANNEQQRANHARGLAHARRAGRSVILFKHSMKRGSGFAKAKRGGVSTDCDLDRGVDHAAPSPLVLRGRCVKVALA